MKRNDQLMHHTQSFFQEYLRIHRGLSQNTVLAYRDAIKMFLGFVAIHCKKNPGRITLDDLKAEVALSYLKNLENQRKNSTVTRNLRLAALRTFFLFLSSQDPLRVGEYQRIRAIPQKRAPRRIIGYLEVDEVKLLLESIDRRARGGERDYVLLTLLYNTGARVQEICDLKVESLHLGASPMVTIIGKGKKTRHVPLWEETAKLLEEYLYVNGLVASPTAPLFLNSRNQPLGRFGIRHIIRNRLRLAAKKCPTLKTKQIGPHTFRHTTAMHLLQSGVDLSVIKSWLGHVALSTTHAYIEINMEMKRKALASCSASPKAKALKGLIDRNRDVITWLESL